MPQSTFEPFSLLAPELRLRIWQYCCSERIVSLRYIPEQDMCLSTSTPPVVLQVCRESREEALKIYRLSFGTRSSPPRIYFNPHLDTLYRPRWRQMGYDDALRDFRTFISPEENQWLDELRRIAVDFIDVEVKRPWEGYNRAVLLRSFPKLEEVAMVLQVGGEIGLGADEEFVVPTMNPEDVLRKWAEFRQSFIMEERLLEDMGRSEGVEHNTWKLPPVKIRTKAKKLQPIAHVDQVKRLLSELQAFAI